jgi:hypothetical protein
MRISKLAISTVIAAAITVGGVTVAAASDPVFTRGSYAPSKTWSWVDDESLGDTSTAAQYAQADVTGLTDADHNAGFRLRYGTGNILVAVSGTAWKIEPSQGGIVGGPFTHPANGTVKVTIDSSGEVNVLWNGATVATRTVQGSYPGRGVVPSVWQSSSGVVMTNIEAGTFGVTATPTPTSTSASPSVTSTPTPTDSVTSTPTPTVTAPTVTITPTVTAPAVTVTPTVTAPAVTVTPTVTVTGSPSPSTTPTATEPPGGARWLSGASSKYAVNGEYGDWRGEPVKIVGTWSDGDASGSEALVSMGPGTDMAGLNSSFALDIAIGAIFDGQSWSQAAAGAYNDRWERTLQNLKTKTEAVGVLPQNVYIRFAHEYNGNWVDWRVAKGQEADFRTAISRFSALRYEVFGESDAPKVVLCANEGTSGGMADPRDEFVKVDGSGRKVVDVYCVDSYNAWPPRSDATDIRNWLNRVNGGLPDSPEEHRLFAESVGVPFSVGEWSNCGPACDGGGESPNYMIEINNWFRQHAGDLDDPQPGQLIYDVQFNLWDQYAIYGSQAHQPVTASKYAELVWGE